MWVAAVPSPRGLSPRVRGNQRNDRRGSGEERSIPACAGEPYLNSSHCQSFPVYPRVCGGTIDTGQMRQAVTGLSPRVRGNQPLPARRKCWPRSIPACAGEPFADDVIEWKPEVYPRVCGGTALPMPGTSADAGLSPRVRGNPLYTVNRDVVKGSIPACAGEPDSGDCGPAAQRVYPRVCGGTVTSNAEAIKHNGLSPRVRGNPLGGRFDRGGQRSIPACAGEPRVIAFNAQPIRVYPRVCGGT